MCHRRLNFGGISGQGGLQTVGTDRKRKEITLEHICRPHNASPGGLGASTVENSPGRARLSRVGTTNSGGDCAFWKVRAGLVVCLWVKNVEKSRIRRKTPNPAIFTAAGGVSAAVKTSKNHECALPFSVFLHLR